MRTVPIRMAEVTSPGQRGDSHLLIYDVDNNIAYEFYGVTRPTDPKLFPDDNNVELPHTDGQWHAAQESVWNFNINYFRTLGETSADAAGLSILVGLARPDEGLPVSQGGQGAINHALRMTLPSGNVSQQYIYPASHMVGASGGANSVPLGARLRLQNSPTVNSKISTMGPEAQIIAHAMQQYGLILADIGSAMYVTGTSAAINANNNISLVWDMSDVLGLESLAASNFDVVDLTPIVTSLSATNGIAGNSLIVTGKNFSGAAGNISVFVGATPSSTVSVISDSQILLTVPGGVSGMDVTVQSGINETDEVSDSPTANVTAPIFGYGTSSAVPADRFLYLAPVPTIQLAAASVGNIIITGTNNFGAGGSFRILASTNLLLPRTDWTVLTNGIFDVNGNFSFTNSIAGATAQMFYTIAVP